MDFPRTIIHSDRHQRGVIAVSARLSRRAALRTGLLAGLGMAAPRLAVKTAYALYIDAPESEGRQPKGPESYNKALGNPPLLGRVEADWQPLQSVRSDPGDPHSVTHVTERLDVIAIYGAIHAAAPYPRYAHNDIWFKTDGGYIHSSYVVAVREIFNLPEPVDENGFWGEVSVPLTRQYASPDLSDTGKYRFKYGQLFHVAERIDDAGGKAWYRLTDDGYVRAWWVDARHIRRIQEPEFAAISPEVAPKQKRIEVNITRQELECYEGSDRVFATRVASGRGYINEKGEQFGFRTPPGHHWIQHKRPSRHMIGGDPESIANRYDLPGVPWCTYFTSTGAAIHGTFWHNNFGVPQSHGCLNVTNDAAKWIYRWVNPWTGDAPDSAWTGDEDQGIATSVIIIA